MGQTRLTLARLMGLVVVIAFGLTALSHPTPLWASGAFSLALAMNFAATVTGAVAHGKTRSIGLGFAICGWGYLVISFAPWFESHVINYLITTHLIEFGYGQGVPDPFSFHRIVQSLSSIASGLVGGLLGWSLTPETDDLVRSSTNNIGNP